MKKSKLLMEHIEQIDVELIKEIKGDEKLLLYAFLVNLNARNRLPYD